MVTIPVAKAKELFVLCCIIGDSHHFLSELSDCHFAVLLLVKGVQNRSFYCSLTFYVTIVFVKIGPEWQSQSVYLFRKKDKTK